MQGNVDTAIVVPAREKLSLVEQCVDAILEHTGGGFRIYLVDVGYDEATIKAIETRCAQEETDLRVLTGTPPILANAAFNLAMRHVEEPLVCVVENDVIVRPGYWNALRDTLLACESDMASPTIIDGHTGLVHFDPPRSEIRRTGERYESKLVRRPKPEWPRVAGRRRIHHLEKHCFAGTREAMQRLVPLDEQVCTRTDVDLSFSCHRAGLTIWMAPDAEVVFFGPPVKSSDLPYFAYRWDLARATASNNMLVEKWGLDKDGDYLEFVHKMRAHIPSDWSPEAPRAETSS